MIDEEKERERRERGEAGVGEARGSFAQGRENENGNGNGSGSGNQEHSQLPVPTAEAVKPGGVLAENNAFHGRTPRSVNAPTNFGTSNDASTNFNDLIPRSGGESVDV